jgi:hypothetical protein
MLGLNLLRLLTQNRIAEFHAELELVPKEVGLKRGGGGGWWACVLAACVVGRGSEAAEPKSHPKRHPTPPPRTAPTPTSSPPCSWSSG